jgi:hypothetical protein
MMNDAEVAAEAQRLMEAYGEKAGQHAAYSELEAEENGEDAAAQDWHRIGLAVKALMA